MGLRRDSDDRNYVGRGGPAAFVSPATSAISACISSCLCGISGLSFFAVLTNITGLPPASLRSRSLKQSGSLGQASP